MNFNKKAQSVLEYVTVIAFVMVGIILGGEYAMRAMSGGIMNLTRSEEISRSELLRQAPPDPGVQIPSCNCTAWSPPTCGGGPCNERQMYTFRNCTGAGCKTNYEYTCTYDDTCCSSPQLVQPAPQGCAGHSTPPCLTNYGEGWACWQCGNLAIQCGCKPFNECRFRCGYDVSTSIQINPDPNADICNLDDQNIFYNNLPWLLQGSNPSVCSSPAGSDPKCETYCKPGFVKQGNRCVGCPLPVVRAYHDCHCKSNSRCHCACNNTPINVDATCPLGTTAETGYCIWYDWGSGDAGHHLLRPYRFTNGFGESVWRCAAMQAEYHGQSTCRSTPVISIAFCQPQAPCYRSVLVDLRWSWHTPCDTLNPIATTGGTYLGTKKYVTVGVFSNLFRCALIDHYLPAPAGPSCQAQTVMGDAFYHGYGLQGPMLWPNPVQFAPGGGEPYLKTFPNRNTANNATLCGSPPCCSSNTYAQHPVASERILPIYYGCCPRGWKIEGWDKHDRMMHCLRNETNFCKPSPTCPAGYRSQRVVEDAYMRYQHGAGPPSYTFPACDPGYRTYGNIGDPSRMQHCKKYTNICVGN